ncbi:MAG: C69 family dipeptidase [candidate division Zixibacteria bacterium]|nr:C69 family dipeptidase [candidate division Zixibacteria bacterium]
MRACISAISLATAAVLVFGLRVPGASSPDGGCFSIVVGREASITGSVTMAHNEDDYIPQIVNHHKVPRRTFTSGATVELDNDLTMEQVGETWEYIWSEIPGLLYSDSYLNEWGVCICSDACPSREDRPSLTGGGISSMLRRIVAGRARTSREGVRLAGQLVERFGYAGSGRTYIISDPREGWLFCAVQGRHWVAQRVPDNQVAVIANSYTVQTVDLADTVNYLGSADIISYATERGWYHQATDGAFNFARAYANPEDATDPRNIGRQWDGLRRLAAVPPAYGEPLPFSIIPSGKIDAGAIMAVLRSHYEETPLYAADSVSGCPHGNAVTPICRHDTQTSFIAELRGDLPRDIGLMYRVCLSSPCASCYIPFYYGQPSFPDSYTGENTAPTDDEYKARTDKPFGVDPTSAFWTFTSLRHHAEGRYTATSQMVRRAFDAVERDALAKQQAVEQQARALLAKDKGKALNILSTYSFDTYQAAVKKMAEMKLAQ